MDEGSWEKIWSNNGDKRDILAKRLQKESCKSLKRVLKELNISKKSKIIEVGCGTGDTLKFLRDNGFDNSIGIDISESSIHLCKKKGFDIGKDIFLMDGSNTLFKKNSFDVVHSGGLLEHFKDFEPFIREWCRISRKYIIIQQPNHFSIYSRTLLLSRRVLKKLFSRDFVHEYTYKISDFSEIFSKFNFTLKLKLDINFNQLWLLVYERIK